MRDFVILFVHLIVTVARLAGPGGLRSVVAESVLVRHQLLVLNRGRKRAPNLCAADRIIAGLCTLFMRRARVLRSAIALKPSTLLHLHSVLRKRKYRMLFSPERRRRPGPKGPEKELIDAVVAMKRRNPSWGCPRIAQQIALAFGVEIDKDVVRRLLSLHYRPESDSGGPSWLTFLGHMKDSLWSCDLFRCESATLRTYWVLVVMDQFTRRIIGFGVHSGIVDGVALCRMFHRAIRGHSLPKYLSSDHDPLYRFHQFRGRLPRDVRTRQSPGAHRCGISCIDRTRKTAKSKNKRPPVDISFSLLSRKSLHSLRQPQVSKFLEGLIPSRQVSRQVSDRCRSRLDPAELYLGHLARHAAIVEAATTLTHRHCSHPLRRVCGRRLG